MGEKYPKEEPDATVSRGSATAAVSAAPRRCRNKSKKPGEPAAKPTRGAVPSPKFDGTRDGLKGRGLVFDLADPRADRFAQVKREIIGYIRKECQNGGDIRWSLDHEKEKPLAAPAVLGANATGVDKEIFKI
uniref:Uncharacterized protein n=1 Tax=Odontella aurita TaxID=265563 RepID=A0A7S4K779_9STRA|mmetsp:Transcript_63263/g.187052  ORF Transcript_63263/g.187052 Transcript_63263/m.187052 type:complete len:132 (+) Transcript_63263:91-486(+)